MINKFFKLGPQGKAGLVIAIMGVIFSLYNFFIPIYLDEAYYWVWSLTPEWSYYDHPGMVAWVMRPFSLISSNVFIVRLSTVICMSATLYYLFRLALEIANEKTAWVVLFIFSILPVTHMGYVFITPDSPLMMFWAAAQYYAYLAIKDNKMRDFVLAGLLTGLACLSKYTAILLPASVFIFVIIKRRDLLKNYKLYIALLIAAFAMFPILYWNYLHDWVSIMFQYEHGTASGFQFAGWDFVVFLLGITLIPTPIFMWALLKYIFKKSLWIKDEAHLYLVILTLFPMLFFIYKGFFKKMELNWIIPAFLAGVIVIGIAVCELNMKKTLKVGCAFAVTLTILLRLAPILPFPPDYNIADRLLGYKEMGEYVADNVKEDDVIFSDHLTTASLLRYYIKDHRRVYVAVSTRMSQYTIWDNAEGVNMYEKDGIFIGKNEYSWILLQANFEKVEFIRVFVTHHPHATPKKFYIYRCYKRQGEASSKMMNFME